MKFSIFSDVLLVALTVIENPQLIILGTYSYNSLPANKLI